MGKHLTASDLTKVLPKETGELYKVVNIEKRTSTRIVFHIHGEIDFTKLTIAACERLIKAGATFIEKRKKNQAD